MIELRPPANVIKGKITSMLCNEFEGADLLSRVDMIWNLITYDNLVVKNNYSEEKRRYDRMKTYLTEEIVKICTCYCQGMSEEEISDSLGIGHPRVKYVLDTYTQYL